MINNYHSKLSRFSGKILFTCFIATFLYSPKSVAQSAIRSYPFQDTSLNFEQRVDDLIARLTLEEKVAQMLNNAPAIERLSIPAYNWWNEVLHGVARTPYKVTVFPQAIGMAATWDINSIKTMAGFAASEGRAINKIAKEEGKEGAQYTGLTYWTPNINIFRDPRWGRGQETYGEDPYLTAKLGAAFVQGLQGNDPIYLKAAACAKHYAVHSGPEPLRHTFDVTPSGYDLWNTYLPAFKELVVNTNVAGVMCAYNAFYGKPCCGSDTLMVDILRNQWGFNGYVVSDCGAIDDFFKNHKTHDGPEHASADAVLNGTDVECGTSAYYSLVDAVRNNLILEDQIDISVKRLFLIRFRLGLFDPPSKVKYAQIPVSVLESDLHKKHALKMARQSIVLLRNENNILPLKKDLKKIVVLGPNADNEIAVLGNYNGTPSEVISALEGIKNKVGKHTEIVYEQGVNYTDNIFFQPENNNDQFSIDGQQGFKIEYFDNFRMEGEPLHTSYEKLVDKLWKEEERITDSLPAENLTVKYSTDFKASHDGEISFEIKATGFTQFFVNNEIFGQPSGPGATKIITLGIEEGKVYRLELRYAQRGLNGSVKMTTGKRMSMDFNKLAGRYNDADLFIFVGGISPQLEGEEMRVNYPGFNGGDRTTIKLPQPQTDLLKALNKTGKPIVFVMMTGSAVSIPWENENIQAIINAWYGGQSAGTAIADVLFGDYNPAGRLPVTFYEKDEDLPDFNDYNMNNRTYRYFRGKPLYPFGYGLSYTTFEYSNLVVTNNGSQEPGITVSTAVSNTGKYDGEEVVQLYLSYPGSKMKVPLKSLKGFERISIKKGESKTVQFVLHQDDLVVYDENGQAHTLNENILISVGGGQPDTNGLHAISKIYNF